MKKIEFKIRISGTYLPTVSDFQLPCLYNGNNEAVDGRIIVTITLLVGDDLFFGKQIFKKFKGRETPSSSHNDFSTTDDNRRLTEPLRIH